jgi:hypothetical protein
MILIGAIMFLSPVFILVSQWTSLKDRLWVKVINTALSILFFITVLTVSFLEKEIRELENIRQVSTDANFVSDNLNFDMTKLREQLLEDITL